MRLLLQPFTRIKLEHMLRSLCFESMEQTHVRAPIFEGSIATAVKRAKDRTKYYGNTDFNSRQRKSTVSTTFSGIIQKYIADGQFLLMKGTAVVDTECSD